MSTKYYGVKEVPAGKKRASMLEAKEAGQIRYWGAKRADQMQKKKRRKYYHYKQLL